MSQNIYQNGEYSLAHLELLSKFLKPLSIYYFADGYRSTDWYNALKEHSLGAINRFLEEGLLVRPSLGELMEYKFKIPDLKKLCAEKGLPVSGKKADLINRLINSDEQGMQREVSDLQVAVCSDQGKLIAQSHLEMRKQEKQEAERSVIDCLRKREFLQATREVAKYEANQVFPRGLGIDWNKNSLMPNPRDTYILKLIFEDTPTIAKGANQQQLEQLRVAAGLIHLWGSDSEAKRFLEEVERILEKCNNLDFARMLWSSAINKYDLSEYRDLAKATGEKKYKIEILTANDEYVCDACKRLAKKKYPLFGDVPELPHPGCSHACRCGYSLDIGY